MKIDWRPSPNFSSRNGQPVDTIVLHYTASDSAKRDISWLCDRRAQASAHYVIDRDGSITQLVPLHESAWHAGDRSMNARSIGIELANIGMVFRETTSAGVPWWYWMDGGERTAYHGPAPVHARHTWLAGLGEVRRVEEGWWEPYPDAQLAALDQLIGHIGEYHPTAARNLIGHDEVAPSRKMDPGPAFHWDRYSRSTQRVIHSEVIP